MLGSKHGSGQSMDCTAQSMDLCFERAIHGLSPQYEEYIHIRNSRKWWLAKRWPHCLAQNLLNKQYPLVGRLQNPALGFWLIFSVMKASRSSITRNNGLVS